MQDYGQRLSESPLWKWQRNYFARQGVQAWSQNVVPDFVTNNCFTARNFARLMRARIEDYVAQCSEQTPERVYILEAGAGSGRFAFRFLHFLHETELPCPVTYVLTDFTESILQFWRSHPRLKAYCQNGLLDMALYDANSEEPIKLEISGEKLSPGGLNSPVLAIGNYYFDSLPHDLYRLENSQLMEGRVRFTVPEEGGEAGLDQVVQSVEYIPAPDIIYGEQSGNSWDAVLDHYREKLESGTFTFPVGGMKSLGFFTSLSNQGCFMLLADKGPNLFSALQSGRHEEIDKHGAVSVSVNFHALAHWVTGASGQAWQLDHPYHRLNIAAFQMGGDSNTYPDTSRAYSANVADFGPDDFANLKDESLARKEEISAQSLFSFLRLSNWDPEMVLSFYTRLARLLPSQNLSVIQAYVAGLRQSWKLHYALDAKVRFGFLLGGLCAALGEFRDALRFYVASMQEEGESADTVFNAALCLARLGATDECKTWLARAEALGVAREDIEMVLAEI
jgi:hypothetical protein